MGIAVAINHGGLVYLTVVAVAAVVAVLVVVVIIEVEVFRGCGTFLVTLTLAPACTTVPPVFDGVVASAVQMAGYFCPALAVPVDQLFDEKALFWGDWGSVQGRLQVLMVPLTGLFGRACFQHLRDLDPVEVLFTAKEGHQVEEMLVFLGRP